MIFDQKKNLCLYKGLTPNLDDALDFLMKAECHRLRDGWQEVYGKLVYMQVSDIVTISPEPAEYRYEYHKKHIDIHMLLSGAETIVLADLTGLEKEAQFNDETDFGFATGSFWGSVSLRPDDFLICFPNDAHRPWIGNGERIRKILMKIAI
jgi:biofilm protein TabA